MGYVPDRKVYRLEFADPEYAGMEIRIRGLSLRRYKELLAVQDLANAGDSDAIDEMAGLFAGAVVSWNLSDEGGTPLPMSGDTLLDMDLQFVNAVITAWQRAMTGVSAPLDESSPAGGQSPAASIPMEPLSQSQAS